MSFNIKFIKDDTLMELNKICLGEILIGSFRETFEASLSFWQRADYEFHWKNAVKRLLNKNETCLITSIYDPKSSNFLNWWLLYKDGNTILYRNQILFLRNLHKPFDETNPYLSIPKYVKFTEGGRPISEWSTSIDQVVQFLKELDT